MSVAEMRWRFALLVYLSLTSLSRERSKGSATNTNTCLKRWPKAHLDMMLCVKCLNIVVTYCRCRDQLRIAAFVVVMAEACLAGSGRGVLVQCADVLIWDFQQASLCSWTTFSRFQGLGTYYYWMDPLIMETMVSLQRQYEVLGVSASI